MEQQEQDGNSGVDVQMGADRTRKSTNGNITGVMDFGKTYTYTAGIIADYASKTLTTAGGQSIINAAGTDAIDKFSSSTDAQAIARNGWYSSLNQIGDDARWPYSVRKGFFGFGGGLGALGNGGGRYRTDGVAWSDVTFRPVFYAE